MMPKGIFMLFLVCGRAALSLVLEARATQEFPHNACGWNFLVINRDEIVDKLEQAMSIGVLGAILGNSCENELSMCP